MNMMRGKHYRESWAQQLHLVRRRRRRDFAVNQVPRAKNAQHLQDPHHHECPVVGGPGRSIWKEH